MKKHGFTFIEIAIVTLIIGLLATLGAWAVLKADRAAKIKNAEADLDMLGAAILQLAWDTGRWPNGELRISGGSREIWDLSVESCGLFSNDGTYENWQGPYYDGTLEDPWYTDGEDHRVYFFDPDYRMEDGTMRVVIGSFGPNGVGPNYYDHDDVKLRLDD